MNDDQHRNLIALLLALIHREQERTGENELLLERDLLIKLYDNAEEFVVLVRCDAGSGKVHVKIGAMREQSQTYDLRAALTELLSSVNQEREQMPPESVNEAITRLTKKLHGKLAPEDASILRSLGIKPD